MRIAPSDRIRVLATDAHELAGLGAVRSLGRAGYWVVAGYPEGRPRPPAVYSRFCEGSACYPDPWTHQFAFREWLVDAAERRQFDAILPIAESAVAGVAAVRPQLLSRDITVVLPSDRALAYSLSKYRATAMACAAGILCPSTVFVQSPDEAAAWNDDLSPLRFPVIVKTDNHVSTDGRYVRGRRFILQSPAEAAAVLGPLRGTGIGVIAQEVIPGTGAGAFALRFGGRVHMTFAHRRLHEIPYWGGYSSFRASCHDPAMTALAAQVLDAAAFDGVAMVEFRRSSVDGRDYFLEINGRLWGSLALALHAGADFPRALLECYVAGAPAPQPPYRSGVRCRNVFPGEVKHLKSIVARSRPAHVAPRSRLGALAKFGLLSLNPRIRHDHLWWSDPLPGAANVARAMRWAMEEGREMLTGYARRLRDRRLLARVERAHRRRLARPAYFSRPVSTIAFVCYGNICRSAFAELYWNRRLVEEGLAAPMSTSCGFHHETGRPAPAAFAQVARRHGVDLEAHRSRRVDDALLGSADAIFVMDLRNYRDLVRTHPAAAAKTHFLGWFGGGCEIADPYRMTEADAEKVVGQIEDALDGLLGTIIGSGAARQVA